jgi:anti-sigma regulatory factor (Ser/Thr protein kinase)
VALDADVYGVRRGVRAFAGTLGFGKIAREELVIVASELASNILKYGVRGEITIQLVYDDSGRPGIEIAAHDVGPPIKSFETALKDGWTDSAPIDPLTLFSRRGIGAGLGAVARLSDRIYYRPGEAKKTIIAQRFLRRHSSRPPRRSG